MPSYQSRSFAAELRRKRELRAKADPSCYACGGTGRIIGFGHDGQQCPCTFEGSKNEK
jgi:hypothetical protein